MVGFEPTTCRLRIVCSTAELRWRVDLVLAERLRPSTLNTNHLPLRSPDQLLTNVSAPSSTASRPPVTKYSGLGFTITSGCTPRPSNNSPEAWNDAIEANRAFSPEAGSSTTWARALPHTARFPDENHIRQSLQGRQEHVRRTETAIVHEDDNRSTVVSRRVVVSRRHHHRVPGAELCRRRAPLRLEPSQERL